MVLIESIQEKGNVNKDSFSRKFYELEKSRLKNVDRKQLLGKYLKQKQALKTTQDSSQILKLKADILETEREMSFIEEYSVFFNNGKVDYDSVKKHYINKYKKETDKKIDKNSDEFLEKYATVRAISNLYSACINKRGIEKMGLPEMAKYMNSLGYLYNSEDPNVKAFAENIIKYTFPDIKLNPDGTVNKESFDLIYRTSQTDKFGLEKATEKHKRSVKLGLSKEKQEFSEADLDLDLNRINDSLTQMRKSRKTSKERYTEKEKNVVDKIKDSVNFEDAKDVAALVHIAKYLEEKPFESLTQDEKLLLNTIEKMAVSSENRAYFSKYLLGNKLIADNVRKEIGNADVIRKLGYEGKVIISQDANLRDDSIEFFQDNNESNQSVTDSEFENLEAYFESRPIVDEEALNGIQDRVLQKPEVVLSDYTSENAQPVTDAEFDDWQAYLSSRPSGEKEDLEGIENRVYQGEISIDGTPVEIEIHSKDNDISEVITARVNDAQTTSTNNIVVENINVSQEPQKIGIFDIIKSGIQNIFNKTKALPDPNQKEEKQTKKRTGLLDALKSVFSKKDKVQQGKTTENMMPVADKVHLSDSFKDLRVTVNPLEVTAGKSGQRQVVGSKGDVSGQNIDDNEGPEVI